MLCTRRAVAARKHTATHHRLRLSRAVTPAENSEILGELTQDSPSWLSNISVRSALFEGQHAAQVRGTDRHATLFPHLQILIDHAGKEHKARAVKHPSHRKPIIVLFCAQTGGKRRWSDICVDGVKWRGGEESTDDPLPSPHYAFFLTIALSTLHIGPGIPQNTLDLRLKGWRG